MKKLILVSILVLAAMAQGKAPKKSPVALGLKGPKLTTDARFDGSTVAGKTQAPMEALTVVENEKTIDDLIGVRRDFNDRRVKAKGLR